MTERQREFVRALADYLAGPGVVEKSILLGKPQHYYHALAREWADIRSTMPLFGYPPVEEAEAVITKFLWPGKEE